MLAKKGSNGEGKCRRKVTFLWGDYNFTHSHCAKIHLWAKILKGNTLHYTKKTQNKAKRVQWRLLDLAFSFNSKSGKQFEA